MSFSKSAARDGKVILTRPQTKSESAASEIERLLESRGVAPLAAKAVTTGKEIGKGRFKKVHQGSLRQRCGQECRDVVILRYAKKCSLDRLRCGQEVRELDILALLAGHAHSDSFVPKVFGVVNENTAVSVVQELAIWGTLRNCLGSSSESWKMTVAHKLYAGVQIARALDFLKSASLVHADLACRNVLLFKLEDDPHALVAKMSDFGLAVVLDEGLKEQYLRQPQATRWCSPETVAYGKLSYQSDVWAFGATLWELFADGASPWVALEKRADVTSKLNSLANGGELTIGSDLSLDFPLSSEACPPAAYSILLSCLQVGEDARPTAAELEESLEIVFDEEAPPIVLCADTENSIGSSALDESEDAESTSASTEASLSERQPIPKTLVRQLSSKLLEADMDSRNSKFEVLSEFLWSESAVGTLGGALVRKMQQEVRQALRREDFLTSLAEDKPCTSDVGHLGDVDEAEVQSAETPIRELLLPLVSKEGRLRCWGSAPALSIWTLWSLAEDDALLRRDYASEAAARAALQAEGMGGALVQQAIYSS